jgi:hypothetical protein
MTTRNGQESRRRPERRSSRRWQSACLRDHRSDTGRRSGLRYQTISSAPGLVMFAAPMASRCRTFSSFAASFSSETDSHCFRSPSRTRPPATASLVPGRVHGDPEVQLDDFPVAPGSGTGLDAGNPAGRLRLCRGRLAGATNRTTSRLWGFCGDLEDCGGDLRHLHFLASCVSAGRRTNASDLRRWSGAGSNRRPSAFQVNRAKRYANLQKRTSLISGTALGGRCEIRASRTY